MKFIDSYFTYGFDVDKDLRHIIKKVKDDKAVIGIFVVVFALSKDGILEIYPYIQLLQKHFTDTRDSIRIVGIATDYNQAVTMVQDIVQDICDNTSDFDYKNYFEKL